MVEESRESRVVTVDVISEAALGRGQREGGVCQHGVREQVA